MQRRRGVRGGGECLPFPSLSPEVQHGCFQVLYNNMPTDAEERRVLGVWVKALQSAAGYLPHARAGESEHPRIVVLGRADDGDGFRQHELVGAVCMQVYTGQEGRLGGVGMDPAQSQQTVVVLETEELLYVLHITVVWAS